MYWKPKASYPYFGPATYTEMKWDNKTHIEYYARTLWQNKVVTERYLRHGKTCGLAKIIFPTGIVFHTDYDDGELDSRFLFSSAQQVTFKFGSILL